MKNDGVWCGVVWRWWWISPCPWHIFAQAPAASVKGVSEKARLLAPQWRLQDCNTSGLEVQGITAVAVCWHRIDGCSGGLQSHDDFASQIGEAMVA